MANKKIVVTDYQSYSQNNTQINKENHKKHYYFEKKSEIIEKKLSIRDRLQNFKNSFFAWTHTKQAASVLIFSVIAILVIIGVFVWGAITKVKISEYFLPEVNAIIYETSSGTGTGIAKKIDISKFENHTEQEHFQIITFTAKEQSSIYFNYLYFTVYSEYAKEYDLNIIIKNHSFSSDFIYKTEIHFKENTTLEYKLPLKLLVSSPNNETTMTFELIPKDDSIPFSIGNMKFIK